MSRTHLPKTFWFGLLAIPLAAFACEYLTVRDAAFQEPRDIHRLVLFARDGDEEADAIAARISERLAREGKDLNLEFVRVDVDAEGIDWSDYGIPGPPPTTPVTAFIGANQRTRKNFFVHHWNPAPSEEEVTAVIASPFRDRMAELLPAEVAVMVHVPGDLDRREDLPEMLAALEAEWDAKEKNGVSRMTLDRNDPTESILLAFLGIPKEGPDWVGIFFGRAKAMDPWVGEEIEEVQLNHQIETLIGECNCLMTAGSLGVDLPMVWTEAMDARMVFLREAEEEESLLAGMKDSAMLGGPFLVLVALLIATPLVGGGVYLLRARRSSLPLVTPANR